ncbi:HSP31 [Candida oxycetoniae]|uniref:D-lactate dehydratase n=1 Tax=Candida oxycetoniae TaxID=497107 RepID=A0AAI9WYR2_9ASCO|nr:HSP31 [Candida oxycetoniae]KAI3405621.2 HSP31 [Candida oxycetoniae]
MVKVLIALTSYNEPFYPDGQKTGVFVTEAIVPYLEFVQKRYDVTFASETGTFGYDEKSTVSEFLSGKEKDVFDDANSTFNVALKNIKKASDLEDEDFDVFFASAGHGTLFDYPHAKSLQKIAAKTWANGKVVSAICHGPAIFLNLIDPKTHEPLIKGKKITGFTDEGEDILKITDILKKKDLLTVSQIAKKEGAEYVAPNGPWDSFTVADGKLITGVNPQSAMDTARKIIAAVESVSNSLGK